MGMIMQIKITIILMLVCSVLVGGRLSAAERLPGLSSNDAWSVATFAGGSFWSMEAFFEKLPGVQRVYTGYSGPTVSTSRTKQVRDGRLGHVESIQVYFDRRKVSFSDLVHSYVRHVDPTDNKGQFVARGKRYRPIIFYHNVQQFDASSALLEELEQSKRYDKPVVIEIKPYRAFYMADTADQNYYLKSPVSYRFYQYRSGREEFQLKVWGDANRKTKTYQSAEK